MSVSTDNDIDKNTYLEVWKRSQLFLSRTNMDHKLETVTAIDELYLQLEPHFSEHSGAPERLGQAVLFDAFVSLYDPDWLEIAAISNHGHISPASIADIGTGTGRLLPRLRHAFTDARIVGIEVNPERSLIACYRSARIGSCSVVSSDALESLHIWGDCDLILLSWVLFAMPYSVMSKLLAAIAARRSHLIILQPDMFSDYNQVLMSVASEFMHSLGLRLAKIDEAVESLFSGFHVRKETLHTYYIFPDLQTAKLLLFNALYYWHGLEIDNHVKTLINRELAFRLDNGKVCLKDTVKLYAIEPIKNGI